ncbi:sugar phosphate isomerase/epimerase family protein [Bauldia sp.]|uniref:sugar phosphate isomerase/epimerase family protein n=1 Tax=Bauldia sp. TaxID=2575872 RepID=UPI003BA9E769
MKVGCFALVDPFSILEHQLERIAGLGFKYADVTDNHPGGLLGREFGFSATASLDDNPADLTAMFARHGLTATSVCAHANLLDASAPFRYGNAEISKAVRLASGMAVRDVITTEGEPHTDWGRGLSRTEQVFVIVEKLLEAVRLAEALNVRVLLEPHGPVTGTIDGMGAVLDRLGHPETVGVNLDTGNSWLAGTDPVEMARAFKDRIWHVHWKDMSEDWVEKRGQIYGCGMAVIPLGSGVVDIDGVYDVVKDSPAEYSTLEIAGDENVRQSHDYLRKLGCE